MKMKWIYGLWALVCIACNDHEIGFLDITNAEYAPNSMEIPMFEDVDPIAELQRLDNESPWVTLPVQGVLGTQPIIYTIDAVKSSENGNVEIFKKEISILGSGVMYYPLKHNAPAGTYTVSIRLTNEGFSKVMEDVYTFILK